MIDPEGRARFLESFPVSRETLQKLDLFVELVVDPDVPQNLVARSTVPIFWERHMLDSAQLIQLSPSNAPAWLDVGAGAGLPGLVLAILTDAVHVLVEPRRLRAEFLSDAVARLELGDRVQVVQSRVEAFSHSPFAVITARAFASLTKTLKATRHLANADTVWLLNKGREAAFEVADAERAFDASLTMSPSMTAADASIVTVRAMAGARS